MSAWILLASLAALAVTGLALDQRSAAPPAEHSINGPAPAPVASPTANLVRDANGDLINLDRAQGRLTVKVLLGQHGPHDFLIDTGAQHTSISRELAQRLGYAAGPQVRLISMSGAEIVPTVHVPLIQLSRQTAAKNLLAPSLEAANMGAAGLLGVDALAGQRVVIDMAAQEMRVLPSFRAVIKPGPDDIVVEARSVAGQLILTDAYYGNVPVRVVIDTGSAVTIANSAFRKRVARNGGQTVKIDVLSVTGGAVSADYGRVAEMMIGTLRVRDMPVAYADVEPFHRLGLDDKPALLLGMDMIKQFRRVEIDFANRRVRFSLPDGA